MSVSKEDIINPKFDSLEPDMRYAIGRCMEEYAAKWRLKADQAENLLERIIMDHALGIEMNVELYREINTFLYGNK